MTPPEHGHIKHFVCPSGRTNVGIYDYHDGSATQGEVNEFVVAEHNRKMVGIPGASWHGFKVVSNE